MFQLLSHLRTSISSDQQGATMVEYGLLIAFVALLAVVGVAVLGDGLDGLFTNIGTEVGGANVPTLPGGTG